MKRLISFLLLIGLFSCNEEDVHVDLSNVTLSSEIHELSDGSLQFKVFDVEGGGPYTINTVQNPLQPYSFGIMTYTDAEAKPIGIGLSSLTMDLEFINLSNLVYENIFELPDSLFRAGTLIEIHEGSIIGVVSKTRRLKLKVNSATLYASDNGDQSMVELSVEYL